MKFTSLVILILCCTVGPAVAEEAVTFKDLFHISSQEAPKLFGADTTKCFELALADFNAVLSGRPPINARVDTNAPIVWDGGTTFYVGDRYKLTVAKSMTSVGGVHGYIYGPVLSFDPSVMAGNSQPISRTAFFSVDVFAKLTKQQK